MGNHSSRSRYTETFASSRTVRHFPAPKSVGGSARGLRNLIQSLQLSKHSLNSKGSSLVSESLASSPCTSVRLLSFRPSSSSSVYTASTPTSSSGSLKSDISFQTTSSTGSNFKRTSRGRSLRRYPDNLATSPIHDGNWASPADQFKTPYPVTVKEALFLPQFPIRSATCITNKIIAETALSSGKFGDVTKVHLEGKADPYALKRIRKNFVVRSHTIQQAKEEAIIQRVFCVHPFLVSAIDSWQSRTHLCILTEFVEGGDLSTLWHRHGAFPEEVVKLWGLEMALALDHLHSRGILYRDLKLANTLLDSRGHLKLADFGLAKILAHTETRAKTICGTLNYMAPEILSEREYEASADWWSYGICLYALLVGEYPVEPAYDHTEMCEQVMRHRYIDFDSEDEVISPAAVHLLDHLLRKNPVSRLQNLQAIRRQPFFCDMNLVSVFRKIVSPFEILLKLDEKKGGTVIQKHSRA